MKKPTTDVASYLDLQEPVLMKMLSKVRNDTLKIDILYFLIVGSFSAVIKHVDYYMERQKWNLVTGYINQLLDLLNKNVPVSEKRQGKLHIYRFFESAHRELHTAFQRVSYQDIEYVKRLHDEHKLLHLGERVMEFYKKKEDDSHVGKTALIMLNHLYAKNNSTYRKMQKLLEGKSESEKKKFYIVDPAESEAKIADLVKAVHEEGYTRSFRIQSTLYQIYHHALHNRYFTARNLMATSQISEKNQQAR
jgi:translation initiation factor 3 subunit C